MAVYYSAELSTKGPAKDFIEAVFAHPAVATGLKTRGDANMNIWDHNVGAVTVSEAGKLKIKMADREEVIEAGVVSGNVIKVGGLYRDPKGLVARFLHHAARTSLGVEHGVEGKLERGNYNQQDVESTPAEKITLSGGGTRIETEDCFSGKKSIAVLTAGGWQPA